MVAMKVIGLDLAGVPKNPSGFARLSNNEFQTSLIYSDNEILEQCTRSDVKLVAIDAPLSLPQQGKLRQADTLLIKRGFRVFPPTFASMRSLTERGIRLADALRAKDLQVIEIHPRTSGMLLFKTSDRSRWVVKLKKNGMKLKENASEHEIDAALAALTGALHLKGKTEEVGEASEGTIIIPRGKL